MEEMLKLLNALKQKRDDFHKKYADDPNISICYSARWMERDDINREIDRTLHRFFELL